MRSELQSKHLHSHKHSLHQALLEIIVWYLPSPGKAQKDTWRLSAQLCHLQPANLHSHSCALCGRRCWR